MHFSARMTLAATCCTLVFTSACSDSTGPSDSQQAAQLAMHFDSLYVSAAAAALADSSGAYSNRALTLTYLELAAALGANASTVSVTTANGTEQWKGLELEDVETSGSALDEYLLVAYRESAAHTMIVAFFNADGVFEEGGIFTNDTLSVGASDATGSTTRTSLSDSCVTPSASLSNPIISGITSAYTCTKAKFNTSLAYTVPSAPNVDPALTSVSFSSTTFNGARLVGSSAGQATARRAHALFRRLLDSKRF